MTKLIKNEFFKLFHKLSTYIIIIVAIFFVILTNVIYHYYDQENATTYEQIDINAVNSFINNYDPSVDNVEDFAYNLALLDSYNLSYKLDLLIYQH